MNNNTINPSWAADGKINDVELARYILEGYDLLCVNEKLFDKDGMITDTFILKNIILELIAPYVKSNIVNRIDQIIETIQLLCSTSSLPLNPQVINVKNGTLNIDGTFTNETPVCANRLIVNYNPNAPTPVLWLEFLNGLLSPEDILTLQEYMGYCFIPTNKAQKMLIIIGNGGEGKSRIGLVLRALLGDNMNTGDVKNLEKSQFSLANLEYKLLMLDDDMSMEALEKTNVLKSMVTLEAKTELEIKNKQSFQGLIYSRALLIGNGSLSALHDRSYGFYRRQIILEVLPRDVNRVDDPYLIEKLKDEIEGIFLWCFEGLQRLVANDYRFTISEKAVANLANAMEEGNNVILFMQSTGYISIENNSDSTPVSSSKNLCKAYKCWCDDNTYKPLSDKNFISYLKQHQTDYGIIYTNNISTAGGKTVRGFKNINVLIRPEYT